MTQEPVLVETERQVIANIRRLYKDLQSRNAEVRGEAMSLIEGGKNLVALQDAQSDWFFAPSRFVGYENNSAFKHITGKDYTSGTEATERLNRIFGEFLKKGDEDWQSLEASFLKFCKAFSCTPWEGKKLFRKFWCIDAALSDIGDRAGESIVDGGNLPADGQGQKKSADDSIAEGEREQQIVWKTQRASKLRRKKLQQCRAENQGKIVCETCGVTYETKDKKLEECFFEVHHKNPLSKRGVGETELKELAVLCASCHRFLHNAAGVLLTPKQGKKCLPRRSYVF